MMFLTRDMYVPSLRWRLGEYQALFRLAAAAKARTVPFITIPDVEYDFETHKAKKTVHDHVQPFAARFSAKWGAHPAWVSVHPRIASKFMDDDRDIPTFVFDALRAFRANVIPAIPLDAHSSTVASVRAVVATDSLGVAISIRLEDMMKPDTRIRIEQMAASLGARIDEVDLVINLGVPNFEPYGAFARALIATIGRLCDLRPFRNFVLIGSAIPETFRDVAKGTDQVPRHDWLFYCELLRQMPADMRIPNYGDCTIVHPRFKPLNMRVIKPSGKLVYTTSDSWEVRKGGAFRDNPAQMHAHCASIVASGKFKGSNYSSGDDYIAKCAIQEEGASNQTRWKAVGINHHITHVLDDLSTLAAAP